MASFFNMKGTTQSDFMVGIKGPILQKYVISVDNVPTTYLLLPDNTVGTKLVLDKTAPLTNYITKSEYTGNAATATKLSSSNIGLAIDGIRIAHTKPNGGENSGLSDGSDKIYGNLLGIDASKIELVTGHDGLSYTVLSGIVASGDLNGTIENANQKIASASHTHGQYVVAGPTGLTLTTKSGDTGLGVVKIDNSTETATGTAETPQTISLNLGLRNNAVDAANIKNNAVTADKINSNAVTTDKINPGAIVPAKLQSLTADGNGGYTNGDYTGQIAKVVSANKLNHGGYIDGMALSDIFSADTQNPGQLTSVVKSAYNAYNVYDTATANSKTAAQIITAVTAVSNASGTKSVGNIVLWTDNGITGNLTGNVTGNATTATSAGKLTSAVTLWGNSFDGSASIGTASAAGEISNTGHVTPYANDTYSLGNDSKKYKNAYLSGELKTKDATATGTITTSAITISTNGTGINLNNANITSGGTITASAFASTGSSTIGTRDKTFSSVFISSPSALKWPKENSQDTITLKGALDEKSDVGHTHNINALTVTSVGSDGYITLADNTTKVATSAHTHHMSDIEDIAGVYQFKDTIASVTIVTNNGKDTITVPGVANPKNGDVYNVTSSFSCNGDVYPAGTNIVYEKDTEVVEGNETVTHGEWKPLGGTFNVDLGDYITSIEALGLLDPVTSTNIMLPDGRTINNNGTYSTTYNKALGIRIRGLFENRARTQEQISNQIIPNTTIDFYLPNAATTVSGLVKIWDSSSSAYTNNATKEVQNYGLLMDDSGRAYVHVNWEDNDTVDKYSLITTSSTAGDGQPETTSSNMSIGKSNTINNLDGTSDNPIYLKFLHDDDSNTRVAKRIKIQGIGDANVQLTQDYESGMATGTASTLSINVPTKVGFSIPLIKCMSEPIILDEYTDPQERENEAACNVISFSADPDIFDKNGVFSNDGNKIKDGSLVLLYLNHVDKIYNTKNFMGKNVGYKNGVRKIKVHIPGYYFPSFPTNGYVDFALMTPTRESNYMYFADLSKKLFLCQLNIRHGSNTVDYDLDSYGGNTGSSYGGSLKIIEDVGQKFEDISSPRIFMNGNKFVLNRITNNLGDVIRRYNGIADVIVRTLHLGKHGTYVPLYDLDVNLTKQIVSSEFDGITNKRYIFKGYEYIGEQQIYKTLPYYTLIELFDRNTLIRNITYRKYDSQKVPILASTPVSDIVFKGDVAHLHNLKDKRNVGIKKKNGHINLSKLNIQHEEKHYMRDYSKIKFQYVLHFNSSDIYDICGEMTEDEYTLVKSSSQQLGYWSIIIKKNNK